MNKQKPWIGKDINKLSRKKLCKIISSQQRRIEACQELIRIYLAKELGNRE